MKERDESLTVIPEVHDGISNDLRKVLNAHGYSFQYAVIKKVLELASAKRDRFRLEGTEIPVGPDRDNTHIDVVIETVGETQDNETRFFLIGECKRVDPARGRWCFAQSPYTWPNAIQTENTVQFDRLYEIDGGNRYKADTTIALLQETPYSLGFELRTDQKGNGIGSADRSAISAAVSQVLRGVRGFIQHLNSYDPSIRSSKLTKLAFFIPVVFTTAELLTTDLDISSANLLDGNLEDEEIPLKRVKWLWLNHNRSLALSHEVPIDYGRQAQYNRHCLDFTRSLAIVNPNGIEEFLDTDFYRLLPHRR